MAIMSRGRRDAAPCSQQQLRRSLRRKLRHRKRVPVDAEATMQRRLPRPSKSAPRRAPARMRTTPGWMPPGLDIWSGRARRIARAAEEFADCFGSSAPQPDDRPASRSRLERPCMLRSRARLHVLMRPRSYGPCARQAREGCLRHRWDLRRNRSPWAMVKIRQDLPRAAPNLARRRCSCTSRRRVTGGRRREHWTALSGRHPEGGALGPKATPGAAAASCTRGSIAGGRAVAPDCG